MRLMELLIHIDGGSRGNPGPAAAGVVVRDAKDDVPLHEAGYYLGRATNNVAEYQGLIYALKVARELGSGQIMLHSDSQLLVRQVNGQYKVKSKNLHGLFDQAVRQLAHFDQWSMRYVPREDNRRADELVNQALDKKRDVVDFSMKFPVECKTGGAGRTGSPQSAGFLATIVDDPGDLCPAVRGDKGSYHFGPQTPAGMCMYAAKAVLDCVSVDDKIGQSKPRCLRCNAMIKLELYT